ncbi:MAG: hypothetical protein H8E66_24295 [Planctomycetes bacterium]|nr:hypothetical protein [Planctomycetota bacterium]
MTGRRLGNLDVLQLVGALLAAQFVFACAVKVLHGVSWQLLWFCHVSLAFAAVGCFTRSKLLKSTALTNVLVLHSLWIIDFVVGYTTGTFPFTFSAYIRDVDIWSWLASLHHLYLLPLLLWSFWRERDYPREAWLVSATLFVLVMLASRSLLSPAQNVNYAYFIPESLQICGISTLNRLPGDLYLLGLHAIANLVAFLPAALALHVVARRLQRRGNVPTANASSGVL